MNFILFAILIMITHITINFIQKSINKRRQHTFVYCPRCNNELVKNGQYIEDNNGIIKYRCSKCGIISLWDFVDFPVPYLRTCGDCEYLIDNEFGEPYCENEEYGKCNPDTQRMFEHK